MRREDLRDGTVRISDEDCEYEYRRPRPEVVVISISGEDAGQFGAAPNDELRTDIVRYAPIEIFFDMAENVSATIDVQGRWTDWFSRNRAALKNVSILVRTKYMHVTVEIAKHFSRTGELIRVYMDEAKFEQAITQTAPGFQLPRRDAMK